ncbi:MAG: hypothetical protein OIF47_14540 [Marinibacterium sp.]|nr:hypothetical protein [Marinibacterium sp.]
MPVYHVTEGIAANLKLVDYLFARVFNEGVLDSGSATEARLTVGTFSAVVTGADLTYGGSGAPALTGGTLTSLIFTYRIGYVASFTELALDVETLAQAASAEATGTDIGAFEALLYPLDWTILSNSSNSSFARDELSYDGVPIAYSGDNLVRLEWGSDRFFGGAGNDTILGNGRRDTIFGGLGDDSLRGGGDNDLLQGNMGNDTILGGGLNDTLGGGRGNDVLDGGARDDLLKGRQDQDTLIGGAGNDTLFGGSDGDEFRFVTTGEAERDLVQDFETGLDTITIYTDEEVSWADTGRGLRIDIGSHVIWVKGVDSTDLDPGSLQIFDLA